MKKKFVKGAMRTALILLLFVSAASCSEEVFNSTQLGDEITTVVSVSIPESTTAAFQSRAVTDVYSDNATVYLGTSGYPSIGNVDLNSHPLTFTVGVYVENTVDGETVYTLVDKQSKVGVSDDQADFNFRLIKGQTYRIVAYADFSGQAQENLEDISFSAKLNDELNDAFFASQEFCAEPNLTVVLKRPFGKLRLIARDFDTFAKGEVLKFEKVKVTYTDNSVALSTNSFNAISGKFNEATDIDKSFEATSVIYKEEYKDPDNSSETNGYAAVFTMYLPVNFGTEDTSGTYAPVEDGTSVPQSWMYPFDIEVTYIDSDNNENTIKRSYDIDIPVKRNWLTTVDVADFWTDNSTVTVSIDHRFEGFINYEPEDTYVKTERELQAAITAICDKASPSTPVSGKIILGADIEAAELGGFSIYKTVNKSGFVDIYLDLNGYSITSYGDVQPSYTNVSGSTVNTLGVFSIENMFHTLHITDSRPETGKGGIYLKKRENGANLVSVVINCYNGGCVVIENGRYINDGYECVYIYEDVISYLTAQQQAYAYLKKLNGNDVTKPDAADMALYNKRLKTCISKATINGGYFQNGSSAAENQNAVLNIKNTEKDKWETYRTYLSVQGGLPAWLDLPEDPYPALGYFIVQGGSYVEFNPALGDNYAGNEPEKWVDDEKYSVLEETVDGKKVYTVVPVDSPDYH